MNKLQRILARKCRPGFVLLAILLSLSLPLHSALAEVNLYQGRAPISDRSNSEQGRAMQAALLQVLQKLSGVENFNEYPGIENSLSAARSMVVAFYFQNQQVLLPDGGTREDPYLVVNFSPRAVDQLRVDLQLPRWKPDRKPLTTWPIVDDGLERRILPIELQYAWDGMNVLAEDRGMPVRWPVPDENGEYAVDVQLLWGGYTEELEAEGLAESLVIAARQDGPEWNVRMNLEYEGLRWSQRFRGADLVTLLNQGMNQVITQVATRSSIAAFELGSWTVEIAVTDVTHSDAYLRCLSYLQGLNVVDRVSVKAAKAGAVQFSLALNAAPEYLQQYLASGGVLLPSEQEGVYQLQP